MKLFIVIPFLNEAANIPRLARELTSFLAKLESTPEYQIILVDDGSTDDSITTIDLEFAALNYKIIRHSNNLGPGAAFQSAFAEIIPFIAKDDYVLTIEADNTSNLAIVPQMLKRSLEGYDLILASPYVYGGAIINTPIIKYFLSFFSNLFLREALGLRGIFTMSSFFRLYKGSVLLHIAKNYSNKIIQRHGFEGKVELLMKLVFCQVPLSEVPLVLNTANRKGKSKMKAVKTAIALLSLYLEKNKWKKQGMAY